MYYLFILLTLILTLELGLRFIDPYKDVSQSMKPYLLIQDEFLGTNNIREGKVDHRFFVGDEVGYRVNYTIKNHMRVTKESKGERCLVFLGDSFSFGYGVDDEDNFPFLISKKRKDFKVYNKSVSGYSPAQVYQSLLTKDKELEQCQDVQFIYSYLHNQLLRMSGYDFWNSLGPRYKLSNSGIGEDGRVCENYLIGCKGIEVLNRTHLIQSKIIQNILILDSENICSEYDVFKRLVKEMNHKIKAHYPEAKFIVNIFDNEVGDKLFKKCAITIKEFKDLKADKALIYPRDLFLSKYWLYSHFDKHPNSLWHRGIATRVMKELF